jgi:hypothetical protein
MTRFLIAMLAVFVAAVVSACGGQSEEWQYGYRHADSARGLISQGVSAESACRSIAGLGYGRENGVIRSADAYSGCMAGLG